MICALVALDDELNRRLCSLQPSFKVIALRSFNCLDFMLHLYFARSLARIHTTIVTFTTHSKSLALQTRNSIRLTFSNILVFFVVAFVAAAAAVASSFHSGELNQIVLNHMHLFIEICVVYLCF